MDVRPILFSTPMVYALLDGRKTQTRRVLDVATDEPPAAVKIGTVTAFDERDRPYRWPRTHAVGDVLWVREAAALWGGTPFYRADDRRQHEEGWMTPPGIRWRPSIHMPRKWSRLTLVVTDVRVQRLQDISEADALAEGVRRQDPSAEVLAGGCSPLDVVYITPGVPSNIGITKEQRQREKWWPNAIGAYALLWEYINGFASWGTNPWVSAYTFTVHTQNVDTFLADRRGAA